MKEPVCVHRESKTYENTAGQTKTQHVLHYLAREDEEKGSKSGEQSVSNVLLRS